MFSYTELLHKSVYGFGGVPQTVQANGFITRPSAIAKFSQSAPLSQYIERIQNPIQNRYPKFYPGSSAEQWNLNPDDKSLGFKNARNVWDAHTEISKFIEPIQNPHGKHYPRFTPYTTALALKQFREQNEPPNNPNSNQFADVRSANSQSNTSFSYFDILTALMNTEQNPALKLKLKEMYDILVFQEVAKKTRPLTPDEQIEYNKIIHDINKLYAQNLTIAAEPASNDFAPGSEMPPQPGLSEEESKASEMLTPLRRGITRENIKSVVKNYEAYFTNKLENDQKIDMKYEEQRIHIVSQGDADGFDESTQTAIYELMEVALKQAYEDKIDSLRDDFVKRSRKNHSKKTTKKMSRAVDVRIAELFASFNQDDADELIDNFSQSQSFLADETISSQLLTKKLITLGIKEGKKLHLPKIAKDIENQ